MTGLEIYNFIKPHLGSIEGSGSHSLDTERLQNFEIRGELINCLLEDLENSYLNSLDAHQNSIKKINTSCIDEIVGIHNWLNDYVYDHFQSINKKG